MEEKDGKKRESMSAQIRLSRIVDHDQVMPPSLPMVFLVRSYVHAVRMPPLGRDWDGGQIANSARDEPRYPIAVWSGPS